MPPLAATVTLPRFSALALLSAAFLLGSCGDPADEPSTLSVEELMDPKTCAKCHLEQYTEWSGSMHAYASVDPLFVALNQRGQDEANVGTFCASCHAPLAVRTGATGDGTNLPSLPARLQGVTCYACHAVNQITNTHNNATQLANDHVMRGALSDAMANDAHQSSYSTLHDRSQLDSSKLCGSCHDVVNGHAVAIERSFAEWQGSAFAGSNGSTCGQCHMTKKPDPGPIANVPGAPLRARHSHELPGVDLALTPFPQAEAQRAAVQHLLDNTLQTALCVRGTGSNANLVVIADNVGSGHNWPSGAAQDRRAWFEVAAYANGRELYHSGSVPTGSDPDPTSDADLWLVSDCMLDAMGDSVSKMWAAKSVDSNLLPPQLTFDQSSPLFYRSHVSRSFPKDPLASLSSYPDRATLDVRLQPFPLSLFDDLFADPERLGLDATGVAALREQILPLSVGEQLVWTPEAAADTAHGGLIYIDRGVPMSCVTTTGLNAAADKVAAPEHASAACLTP
ncbi:MAG TPA: multiheme c-type cytochrome [Polyangiaceae bacterium]|nr:multiheme c-type cytochrome [Polyangiaceae bacterium]